MSAARSSVAFEAGGKAYEARLTTNAMCAYEDLYGETIQQVLSDFERGAASLKKLRGLLYVALGGAAVHKSIDAITVDQVGDIIDGIGFAAAGDLVSKLVEAAFPSTEGTVGNDSETTEHDPEI